MVRPAPGSGTASPDEIARFTAMADAWWDPDGDFKPLHRFNPMRLDYIRRQVAAHLGRDAAAPGAFAGLSLLDIGCGGGLLAEPLAGAGFAVTGIDAGEKNIAVARLHAEGRGVAVDYRAARPEDLSGESFDVVLIMEILEHVPDVDAFLAAATARLKPGGMIFFATVNRTAKAYALAIVGAEYLLRWLPPGTHDWHKFLRPSELARGLRRHGVAVRDMTGMSFDLFRDEWRLSGDLAVNYMGCGVKADS